MKRNSFRFLEDEATADIAFLAFGNSLNEIFANACRALVETMIDRTTVNQEINVSYKVLAEDLKGLLYDLLESILFKFETEDLILSEFEIKINEENYFLTVKSSGEKYKPTKHHFKTHIKAITFFGMEFSENTVKVTLDL